MVCALHSLRPAESTRDELQQLQDDVQAQQYSGYNSYKMTEGQLTMQNVLITGSC